MKELFNALRDAANRREWSVGVEASRRNEFFEVSHDSDQLVVQVCEPLKEISQTVRLWPQDEDWHCDCGSQEDPCQHVISSVLAIRLAQEKGQGLQKLHSDAAKIVYNLIRSDGSLILERFVEYEGKKHPILGALKANQRVAGLRILPTKDDLALDIFSCTHRSGLFPKGMILQVFKHLIACDDIRLDDQQIDVSTEQVGHSAVVEDFGRGVRISGKQDPRITEVFVNGMALCGKVLHPTNQSKLTPKELELLASGQHFDRHDIARIATELIPQLQKKLPVEIASTRIPTAYKVEPRIIVDAVRDQNDLVALAKIVYGDPVVAEVSKDGFALLGSAAPVRLLAKEEDLKVRLSHDLSLSVGVEQRYTGEEAISMARRISRWSGSVQGDGLQQFRCHGNLEGQLSVSGQSDALKLNIDFRLEDDSFSQEPPVLKADPGVVVSAWESGERLVPLLQGGWGLLPLDWLSKYGQALRDLLQARQADGTISRCLLPDVLDLCDELEQPIKAPNVIGLQERLDDFTSLPEASLPGNFRGQLRDYQKVGYDWLSFLKNEKLGGALLADDMGLGKTVQTIAAIYGKTIVVAPTSVIFNWVRECQKFRPGMRICLYHGPKRVFDDRADVLITSYALLRSDRERLSSINWDMIVLDEAQNIKNSSSQAARAVYSLQGTFRLALTGTPIENRLDDLWSQFHFLNPGFLSTRESFRKHYVRPIAGGDEAVSTRLRRRVRPFILRRIKNEVLDELPPRTEVTLFCELDEEERGLYSSVLASTQQEVLQALGGSDGVQTIQVLEILLRLRQICCHAGMLPQRDFLKMSSKLSLLLTLLEKSLSGGHKALVFSQWTKLLDRIGEACSDKGISFDRIDGATKNRQEVVDRFQSDGGPSVLLLSLKAAGTGLNLTAADHVFIMDPWWNPAVENQAADRAHRIGQKNRVLVHRLVAKDTVEEKILELQEKKKDVARNIVGGGSTSGLSRDELLDLLGEKP